MTSVGIVANREARLIEFYLFATLVYFVICFSASRVVKRLQHRMATA
jgi:glutamate/aspartate transport system permease protein